MTLNEFNNLSDADSFEEFMKLNTSTTWCDYMVEQRPYMSVDHLKEITDTNWYDLSKNDFLEAFEGHPKIGDVNSLKEKYKNTHKLASNEQSGVDAATDQIINELADYNQKYLEKFGYIFIVCATGKSAEEMLNLLKERINNNENEELLIAAGEQAKITHIRIDKLITE